MNPQTHARPRFHREDRLKLAALSTAPGCARLFVRAVCRQWRTPADQTDIAVLLASELVTNSVEATGILSPDPEYPVVHAFARLIGIRLLEFERSLVIEVWDTSVDPPRLLDADDESEHGRGLQLVDALSLRWGHYYARVGGKIVWCELALLPDQPDGRDRDPAVLQRVLEALQALTWDGSS
jgi:anti-sigma regulatory factor (Ser/Thr protein kinase)